MKQFDTIIKDINIIDRKGSVPAEISNICYDSRKVKKNDIFVAMRGEITDGHKYINKAIELGASVIICEEFPEDIIENIDYIKVENSRKVLSQIAHNYYDHPAEKLEMYGVTGTNGKTTITFILNHLYSALGYKTGIIGTTGIFIGDKKIEASHTTPESLELAEILDEMVSSGIQKVFMEVSSHALVQCRADNIRFKAGIFTNLSHEHLDYHKTMEEYAAAKSILFSRIKSDGFAIVNGDDKYSSEIIKNCGTQNIFSIGRSDNSNMIISEEVSKISGMEFSMNFNSKMDFYTTLIGKFNIDNISMALAIPFLEKENPNKIAKAVSEAKGAPGRMERVNLANGAVALIDYAHTPDALEKALKAAKEVLLESGSKGKLISVFGCGGDRDKTKRPIMGKFSTDIAHFSIVTDDNPRTESPEQIRKEIFAGIELRRNCCEVPGRAEAIKLAYQLSMEGDIILIAGKGHENYQILGTTKHHFDDKEEIMKWSK